MMQKMRDRTQTLLFKVIAGAIILVLLLFGFGAFDIFNTSDRAMATVNGDDIPASELATETDRRQRMLLAQLGENVDPDIIDGLAIQSSTLEELINRTLLLQASFDSGIRASDYQVDRLILDTPDFQIAGTFDKNTYRMLLSGVGLTPVGYRELTQQSMVRNQLSEGFNATPVLFDWELRQAAAVITQQRDLAYLMIDRSAVAADLNVSEEEVTAYYEANGLEFMTAESLDLEYVSQALADLIIDPQYAPTVEEMREEFTISSADFAPEERRRASHILIEVNPDRDTATALGIVGELQQRLDNGETFASIAADKSDDPGSKTQGGDLGFADRSAYVTAFADALYALDLGEISAPVITEFGVHLIRLDDTEETSYPTFEEQQPILQADIARRRATEAFDDLVRQMDELAYDGSDSLNRILTDLELQAATVSGVTRDTGSGLFSDPALRAAAFATEVIDEGYNSPAVRSAANVAVVMRVSKRTAPVQKPQTEVAEDIRERLLADAAALRIEELTAELLAQLEDGAATVSIAQAQGLAWQRAERAQRLESSVPREILDSAFKLSRPAPGERAQGRVTLAQGGEAIVVISAVYDGALANLTEAESTSIQQQMERRAGQQEFDGFFESVRAAASIRRRL